jgi:hypothetical protein
VLHHAGTRALTVTLKDKETAFHLQLIKAGRWLRAQDNLDAEHVKFSSNKTIMVLIKDYD